MIRSSHLTLGLVLALAGCHVGSSQTCTDDVPCAPWGQCSSAGFCVALDAGTIDSGTPDGGMVDAGPVGAQPDAGSSPRAAILAAPLEFGPTDCGGQKALSLQVRNVGAGLLTFTASASNPLFGVTGGAATVPAGQSAELILTARVPATSAPGQQHDGVLTVDTNDATQPRFFIALHATASGVTLAVTPSLISFGVVPVNVDAPPVVVTITNSGTQAATVVLTQPAETQFQVTGVSTFSLDPGASFAGLTAHFRPTRSAPSNGNATLTVSQPVCGVSATALMMTGQGTTGVVGLSTVDLLFGTNGRVACGRQSTSRTLQLSNGGSSAYAWSTMLGRGGSSPFTVSPSSGIVPALGSVTLTFNSIAIPAQASTAAEDFSDVLTITTDAANDSAHAIALHQTAAGAALRLSPTSIDFGNVPVGSSAQAPFALINDGNEPVSLSLIGTAAFSLVGSSPVISAPGSSPLTARFDPGTSATRVTGSLTLALVPDSGVLCAPLPAPLVLVGTGTSGSVGYSPVALDFGAVDCGATGAAQVITFTNLGNRSYLVTPSLALGASSPFTLAMAPASGVVASGGTLLLTVTPRPLPASSAVTVDLYADTLTVTTDVAGDSAHVLPLHQTARGSIFTLSAAALSFGTVPVGVSATSQFTLTNTGNAAGTLRFVVGQPTIFSLPAQVTLAAASFTVVTAAFTPLTSISYADGALLSVTPATVLCQPLAAMPTPRLGLSGVGSSTQVVVVSETSIVFGAAGLVPCGTQAAAHTFTVRNDASRSLGLAFAFSGSPTKYQVSAPASVAAGATVTVVVTPLPVPSAADTSPDFFAEILTVTATGGPVNEVHVVALHQTARGAKLAFSPTTLALSATFPLSDTQGFFIDNTGNDAATYSLALTGSAAFTLTSAATSVAAANRATGSVTYTPAMAMPAQSGSVVISSTSGLCAPLPAALVLNGT